MQTLYFELSWAILSTIGIANFLYGLTIIAITRVTPVSLVPTIVSLAGAVANGLCYYAFYADYPRTNTAVASAFADVLWLVQEAGITFYSYMILIRVLNRRELVYLKTVFWTLLAAVTTTRMIILVHRVRSILNPDLDLRKTINGMHIGYFVGLALIECTSATFLIRTIDILASRITALSHNTQHSLPPISARQSAYREPDRPPPTAGSGVSIYDGGDSAELDQRHVMKYSSFDTSGASASVNPVNPKARLPFDASDGIVRTVEVSVNRSRAVD
ncbi:hypothetical protein LIA77_04925 [Sarocladium implicatum]|nr:hypothetical protein LIA77_04925 [Sarocladium implicatum]